MHFSPLVLLRQPIYTLSHLEAFALDLAAKEATDEDIEALRAKFLSLIQSKHLLLSLPFSSKAVYSAIAHYEFHASVKIRKKEKQSERAFMKYLHRMALNCSPLADFSGSQFCDWEGQAIAPGANFRIDLALSQRKEFFDLCYCDQGLQSLMRHRLNPSLRLIGDGFEYIHIGEDGENAVQIETSLEFEKLYQTLKTTDFTFAEFVKQSEFDVNDFLEAQLITPSYPHYSDSNIVTEIIESINKRFKIGFTIAELAGKPFEKLDDKEVILMQTAWVNKINAYANTLNVSLNEKVYSERVFYLNSALKNCTKPSFDKDLISEELLDLVALIQSVQLEQEGRHIIKDLNQEEDYPATQYAYEKVKLNPIADSAYLELQFNTPASSASHRSDPIGVMLQHTNGEKPNLVNITTAYGKFFAPALPLANKEVKELTKVWVGECSENRVALKDSSIHSKNKSHAFLRELDNFGLDFHSPISDRARLNLVDGQLQEESGSEEVEIVNLGIEELESRSPLLRNMQRTTTNLPRIPEFMYGLQESRMRQLDNGILYKPRIESEHMILALQSWTIAEVAHFPERSSDLSPDMMMLNDWRQNYKMPRIVSFSFDDKKSNYLDFHNPWSVDIFLRSIKNMEAKCTIKELGIPEKIKGIQLVETYFEFKPSK